MNNPSKLPANTSLTNTDKNSANPNSLMGNLMAALGMSSAGSNRVNTGGGDPISSITSSLSNVASALISGNANKEVAKLTVEADKLLVQAEASKADQALYEALKAQAELKSNQALQLANQVKTNATSNWLILSSILALSFGILYLVFKAVFGWYRPAIFPNERKLVEKN